MITGESSADIAVLIIDAHEGLKEQTKKHAYLLKLLGLDNVICLYNKMDKINYDEKRVGPYTKSITITSNAKTSPKIVKVKGKILPSETNNSPVLKPSMGAPIVK